MLFSKRSGQVPVKKIIQSKSIDDDLSNSLWNALTCVYWNMVTSSESLPGYPSLSYRPNEPIKLLCESLWIDYFKTPIDKLSSDWPTVLNVLREEFFNSIWYAMYDYIEFVAQNNIIDLRDRNNRFMRLCNVYLERELSAYRFVGGVIAPIISEEEIHSIETALQIQKPPIQEHFQTALQHLADRNRPDYRNSIKESISAIEYVTKEVTHSKSHSITPLLTKIEREYGLHPALKTAFNKLYGYSSDAEGIRHALTEGCNLNFDDAKFMLVVCTAFVNYVLSMFKE